MKIVNLTPHNIDIYDADPQSGGSIVETVGTSGLVARIETTVRDKGHCGRVPLFLTVVTGNPVVVDGDGNERKFPGECAHTIYVVSGLFRQYFQRSDIYQPGRLIRDAEGRIIGCVGLSQ